MSKFSNLDKQQITIIEWDEGKLISTPKFNLCMRSL